MIDFSFIGKEGIIIQYEDIISLIGFNVMKYVKSKNVNDIANRMSIDDILMSYINRDSEDISKWMKNTFDIDFNISGYIESINTFQPNMLYSYKILSTAYKNGVTNLIIHSEIYSPVIEKFINTYQLPIKYTHGDVIPVLKKSKNFTYVTASPTNIDKCLKTDIPPIALTIVDDFMYVADIVINKVDEELRKRNIYVGYASILSAGMI